MASTIVDTIVCMDGTEVIGAYLAETLSQNGITSMNQHKSIYVVTPEVHSSGQLIFRDNLQPMIEGKHVLLLIASATTGKTIKKSLECIKYYGGSIAGISAIFSVATEVDGYPVHALFTEKDLPDYKTYPHDQCPMCQAGNRIEAIVKLSPHPGYPEIHGADVPVRGHIPLRLCVRVGGFCRLAVVYPVFLRQCAEPDQRHVVAGMGAGDAAGGP